MKNLVFIFIMLFSFQNIGISKDVNFDWWPRLKIVYVSGKAKGETTTGNINCYDDGVCYLTVDFFWERVIGDTDSDLYLTRENESIVLYASKKDLRHKKDFVSENGLISIGHDSKIPSNVMKELGFDKSDYIVKSGKYTYIDTPLYHKIVLR